MQSYEPMALGSPNHPTTPYSPQSPFPSSPNSKVRVQDNTPRLLPSYLRGDFQKRSHSFKHQSASSTPSQQQPASPSNHLPSPYDTSRLKEHKGPPVQSLHEAFVNNRNSNALNSSSMYDVSFSQQHPNNYLLNKTDSFLSPISMCQKDSILTSVEKNTLDHCWVTVFGFPNDATSSILQHFAELGCVLKRIIPEKGNWVHLLYENKIQAKRALSRNGRIMGGCVMVGVQPCNDQTVLGGGSGVKRSNLNVTNALELERALNGEPRKKSPGIISKTLDYVLGW